MRYKEFKELLFELDPNRAKKMRRIYNKMQENPAVIDELWKTISSITTDDAGNFKSRVLVAIDPKNTAPEKDQAYAEGFIGGLVDAIDKTEGTTEERIAFAQTLGTVNHINSKALLQPLSGWSDWLVGTEFSKRLFDTMFSLPAFKTNNKGPGEFALAILSPTIILSKTKGDIVVDRKPIELKGGLSSSGGRLSPTEGTIGQLYKNKEFWNSLGLEAVKAGELGNINKINANNYSTDLLEKYKLEPEHSVKILQSIFRHPGAKGLATKIGKSGTNVKASDLIKLAVKNYGESQGDDAFLILQKDIRTSIYFHIDDLDPILSRLSFSLPLIDSDVRTQGRAQVGILKKSR